VALVEPIVEITGPEWVLVLDELMTVTVLVPLEPHPATRTATTTGRPIERAISFDT